jgi:hypothetical protein
VTPLSFGQRLANLLPDATLKVYAACGHIPMVEAATATTRDLVAFLAADRATSTTGAELAPAATDAGAAPTPEVP